MIRISNTYDFDLIYGYYKEKTLQEKTFVLIEPSAFLQMIDQGFLYIEELNSSIKGFILTHIDDQKSYITMLYGNSIKIKTALLHFYDSLMLTRGITESWIHFFNPVSLAWYPKENIIHPCYQGVRIQSEDYDFYLKNNYITHSMQDTYYLDLNIFQMPSNIISQLEKNQNDGIEITFYDPKKHEKMIEFTNEISAPHWKKVILDNLENVNPLPLLVALKNNQVIGFTGPLRVEENGRGYFAGIGILETERGKKIGKTLFFMLCETLKTMGSTYMTLFTGRDNPARYIYLSAQFQVVASFATMKKIYSLEK